MDDADFSEVVALTSDLGRAPNNIGPFLRSALMRTAGNVKKESAVSVSKSSAWGAAAQAIDYDVVASPGEARSTLAVEVGYNKDKPAGALGNLREFGAPNATYGGKSVPLGPSNDLKLALANNEEDFERGIDRAVDDSLRELGF
jgi:hypothetical protein